MSHIAFGTQPDPRPKPDKLTDERIAKIVDTEAMVYYGWPQKLVAEEATKMAVEIQSIRTENGRWRANSIATWEAMLTMRNDINEHISMPSLDSDLLEGPENSVFCAKVAEAVIEAVRVKVWSPPPVHERPEGFECLVWHRGRWRHVRWVRNHKMWMFGYGSPGIDNDLGRQFAPLPELNPGIYGDFWSGERS